MPEVKPLKDGQHNFMFMVLWALLILGVLPLVILFSFAVPDAGSQGYFYWLNGVYAISVIALIVVEFRWLSLKTKTIRKTMYVFLLVISFFILARGIVINISFNFLFVYAMLTVALVPVVFVLNFFGNQPQYKMGRFSPVILSVVGACWNMWYLSHLT